MLMLSLIQLFAVIVILVKEFLFLIDFFLHRNFFSHKFIKQAKGWVSVCACVRAYSILIDFRKLFESFSILEKIIAYMWV